MDFFYLLFVSKTKKYYKILFNLISTSFYCVSLITFVLSFNFFTEKIIFRKNNIKIALKFEIKQNQP
ncbi:MAG: hypothetical protein EAZ20_01580 [Bacteroidetes bacterium]|nr:MAG: hypothetical protein EAZ20_01580 [Bacteroidota bacterium]